MKGKGMFLVLAVAAVGVYLMTKGKAPWWADLSLSDQQRKMLEDQERDFYPVNAGNTAYPVEAVTGGKVWI